MSDDTAVSQIKDWLYSVDHDGTPDTEWSRQVVLAAKAEIDRLRAKAAAYDALRAAASDALTMTTWALEDLKKGGGSQINTSHALAALSAGLSNAAALAAPADGSADADAADGSVQS
jgi:hypothetical protein